MKIHENDCNRKDTKPPEYIARKVECENINVILQSMKKYFIAGVFFGVIVFASSLTNFALAATTPSLGTATTFGVLVDTYNRNGNPAATITGDFGYTTLSGGVGTPVVNGTTHVAGSVYTQATADRNTALANLNSQPCTFTFPAGTVNLATDTTHGPVGIYTPGVYCTAPFSNVIIGASGITLSGAGTYIFRVSVMLSTAPNSVVKLANGASACDVFWTPGMGPVIPIYGFNSTFIGTNIDPGAANIHDNVTWIGRALFTERLNVASNFKITVPSSCTPPPTPLPTLHVVKHVVNNDVGTATASSFKLYVKGSTGMGVTDVTGSPAAGAESPGTSYKLPAGVYKVSEDIFPGYTATFSGDCDSSGKVTLLSGSNKTCTITNDDTAELITPNTTSTSTNPPNNPPALDNPPPPSTKSTTLRVVKHVINDNGGTATAYIFTLRVKSSGFFSSTEVEGSPAPGVAAPGTTYTLPAGVYKVSEDASGGYTAKFSGDCDSKGKVTLENGDNKTCTITNNDDVKTDTIPKLPNTGMMSWFEGVWQGVINVFYSAQEEAVSVVSPPFVEVINKNSSPEIADSTVTNGRLKETTKKATSKSKDNKKETSNIGFPVRVKIPNINVDAKFQYTGLKSDGEMEGPTGIVDVGWYKNSERPGEEGDSVITGHLAQVRKGKVIKSGVFKDLNKLVAGDKIYVEDNRGVTVTFIVRESRQYNADATAPEVFTSIDGAHLNLITCDGVWDQAKKSYSKRLVIFADKEVK